MIVGHVKALARFPVKSMAGEALETAELDWQGIEGDRQYGLLLADNASRFPWFTGRDWSELIRWRAVFERPEDPRRSAVKVTAPDGRVATADAALAEWLASDAKGPLHLVQSGRGNYDAMPVSIVTTAGHTAVETAHGAPLDPRRFRINVTIESEVPEREWAGRRLAFGDAGAELLCAEPIPRCAMITIDPDTAERDPTILRTVAQKFGNGYGIYASPARPGVIRLGDSVRLAA